MTLLQPIPSHTVAAPCLSINKVSITAFRNYADLCLNFTPAPIVLVGDNGSGKTNLLEAISLLVPGRGLRRAEFADLQNNGAATPWAIAAELSTPLGQLSIGTGRDPAPDTPDRRVVHIDGKIARNQNSLAERIAMAWITPDMDRLLADGSSTRRKFIDRLAYSFDPAHAGRVTRYEKAMRERMRLLREGPADAAWLSALEDEMARTGVSIAAARNDLMCHLSAAMNGIQSTFPQADMRLLGQAEEALHNQPALLVEDGMRAALLRARREDAENGTSSVGTHRTDIAVTHRAKNCPANLCSTGEQKALLITIMIAYLRTLIEAREMIPLFLLDDIAAHLDDARRAALFEEIVALGVQAWITGTDREAFAALEGKAQFFSVNAGAISAL